MVSDDPRTREVTTRELRGARRVGLSVLYGTLTAFWSFCAVIPGSIIQRVGCGLVAVAFGSSTWHAAFHGIDSDDD